MPLPSFPPLSELRLRMARLLRMQAQVERSTSMHGTLDECLRQAFVYITSSDQWAALRVRQEIDLVHGQHAYDIPDGILPGWIEGTPVVVRSTDNREFPLTPGVDSYDRARYSVDRDGAAVDDNVGLPLRWDFWDGQLQVYPAPDVDTEHYAKLGFWARTVPEEPVEDDDKSWIDPSAHVLMALHFYHLDTSPAKAQAYLGRAMVQLQAIRSAQAPAQPIRLGPARVSRFNFEPGYFEGPRPSSERAWETPVL